MSPVGVAATGDVAGGLVAAAGAAVAVAAPEVVAGGVATAAPAAIVTATATRKTPSYRWVGTGTTLPDGSITYKTMEVCDSTGKVSSVRVGDSVLLYSGVLQDEEYPPVAPAPDGGDGGAAADGDGDGKKDDDEDDEDDDGSKGGSSGKGGGDKKKKKKKKSTGGKTKKKEERIYYKGCDNFYGVNAVDPFVARVERMWEVALFPKKVPGSAAAAAAAGGGEIVASLAQDGAAAAAAAAGALKGKKISPLRNPLRQRNPAGTTENGFITNEERKMRMKIRARWYFKREDIEGIQGHFLGVSKRALLQNMGPRDLVLGEQTDDNEIPTLLGKCRVVRRSPLPASRGASSAGAGGGKAVSTTGNRVSYDDVPGGAYVCRYDLRIPTRGRQNYGSVVVDAYEGRDYELSADEFEEQQQEEQPHEQHSRGSSRKKRAVNSEDDSVNSGNKRRTKRLKSAASSQADTSKTPPPGKDGASAAGKSGNAMAAETPTVNNLSFSGKKTSTDKEAGRKKGGDDMVDMEVEVTKRNEVGNSGKGAGGVGDDGSVNKAPELPTQPNSATSSIANDDRMSDDDDYSSVYSRDDMTVESNASSSYGEKKKEAGVIHVGDLHQALVPPLGSLQRKPVSRFGGKWDKTLSPHAKIYQRQCKGRQCWIPGKMSPLGVDSYLAKVNAELTGFIKLKYADTYTLMHDVEYMKTLVDEAAKCSDTCSSSSGSTGTDKVSGGETTKDMVEEAAKSPSTSSGTDKAAADGEKKDAVEEPAKSADIGSTSSGTDKATDGENMKDAVDQAAKSADTTSGTDKTMGGEEKKDAIEEAAKSADTVSTSNGTDKAAGDEVKKDAIEKSAKSADTVGTNSGTDKAAGGEEKKDAIEESAKSADIVSTNKAAGGKEKKDSLDEGGKSADIDTTVSGTDKKAPGVEKKEDVVEEATKSFTSTDKAAGGEDQKDVVKEAAESADIGSTSSGTNKATGGEKNKDGGEEAVNVVDTGSTTSGIDKNMGGEQGKEGVGKPSSSLEGEGEATDIAMPPPPAVVSNGRKEGGEATDIAMPPPPAVVSNGRKEHRRLIREIKKDAVMDELYQCGYDPDEALNRIRNNPDDYITVWSEKERQQFDRGYSKYCGSMRMISKFVPTKDSKAVVDYYYRFKIPQQFFKYQEQKREQARRMMEAAETRLFEGSGSGGRLSSSRKARNWSKTGATEHRRTLARNFLILVRNSIGPEGYAELAQSLKLFYSKDMTLDELNDKATTVLANHPDMLRRFHDFLPQKFRG